MSPINAGDGHEFGVAMVILLTATVLFPFAAVYAWDLFKSVLDGDGKGDGE